MADQQPGGQVRKTRSTEESEEVEATASSDLAERKAELDEDIDSILDEIDDVIEANSEDMVRSFVQKGGE